MDDGRSDPEDEAKPSRRREWAGRFLLLVVSTLLSLVVAEGVVRTFDLFPDARVGAFAVAEESGVELVPHPYRGWMRAPNGAIGGPGRLHFNAFGYRTPHAEYRALSPDDHLVGVLGGSVALGLATEGRVALEAEIGRLRPELVGRVRVVNLATGGYKQPQQVASLLEALILGVPLDIVVNLDGFNEVALAGANIEGGVHPYFPSWVHYRSVVALGGGPAVRDDLLDAARILTLRERARAVRRTLAETPLRHSFFAQTVAGSLAGRLERRAKRLEIEFQAAHAGSVAGLPTLADRCLARGLGDDPIERCGALVADVWARSSIALDALCRAAGIPYLHVLQPNQHLEGTKPLSDEEREHFYRPDHPWSQAAIRGYPLLQDLADDLHRSGVAFHDATGVFRDHPETLYRDDCCHFDKAGNEILARRVARLVVELPPRRGGAPP